VTLEKEKKGGGRGGSINLVMRYEDHTLTSNLLP
jgi:hypothetical protein